MSATTEPTPATTTAQPRAGSVWLLATSRPLKGWPRSVRGPVGARCDNCGRIIRCADRTADWVHNADGDARCG